MPHLRCLFIIAVLFGTLVAPFWLIKKKNAQGQIDLNPTDDTYIDIANYTTNYGSEPLSGFQVITCLPVSYSIVMKSG